MYDLWPPADYPNLTAPTPTVTGCTRNSTVSGLSTFTAQTPAVDAVTTRLIRPIFVKGQGGVLRWSVTVTPCSTNYLSANQASVETNTDGFWSGNGSPTLSTSSVWSEVGTKSLLVTADDTSAEATTNLVAFSGHDGQTVTIYGVAYSPRSATFKMQFYDAGPSLLGTLTATQVGGAGDRRVYSGTGTVPSGTTQVMLRCKETTTPGDIFYLDSLALWVGTGGTFALPNSPIYSDAPYAFDIQQQVLFLDDDDAQVGRWTGQSLNITAGAVLSAKLTVPRLATQAQFKVLSLCDTNAGQWTEYDSRLEQIPADDPYTPPGVDVTFGDMSSEGVAPPAPAAGLPGFEANSPARRSPQVRWCQLHDSVRPDLTPKKNAREV